MENCILKSFKDIQTFDPIILLLNTYSKEIFMGIWENLFSRIFKVPFGIVNN